MESAIKATFIVFGLVDPRTHRVFHVGCSRNLSAIGCFPEPVAAKVAEIAPDTPQIVVLQVVDAHPQVTWGKWSKRFRRDLLTNDWERYEGIANAFQNSNRTKRVLGEEIPSDAAHYTEFHAFDQKHPEVFEELLRRARQYRAEGRKISSVYEIINDVRYKSTESNGAGGFKIGNNNSAFYARKLQMDDPSLCGLFATSPSMADELVLPDGRSWREFAKLHSGEIRFAGPDGTEEDAQWTY